MLEGITTPEIPSCYEFIRIGPETALFNDLRGQQIELSPIPDYFITLCELTNGNHSFGELHAELQRIIGRQVDQAETMEVLGQLYDYGMLCESLKLRSVGRLAPGVFNRFQSTIENLDLFANEKSDGIDFFERIQSARVTIIGLGGNGSLAAMMLAAGGIGHLRIVDGDRVESKNLVRQIFYSEDQANSYLAKGTALKNRINEVNPYSHVEVKNSFVLSKDHLAEICMDSQFVLVTADQPRMLINEWLYEVCEELQIPGMASLNGMLGPMYIPGLTNPFIELKEEMNRHLGGRYSDFVENLQRKRHRDYPSFVTGPIWLGCLQADEIFGEITGAWEPRSKGKAVFINQPQFKELKFGSVYA